MFKAAKTKFVAGYVTPFGKPKCWPPGKSKVSGQAMHVMTDALLRATPCLSTKYCSLVCSTGSGCTPLLSLGTHDFTGNCKTCPILASTTRGQGCKLTEACKNALFCCTYGHFNMMLCGDFLAPGSSVRCFCLLLFLHCSTEAGGHLFVYRIIYTAITRGLGVIIQYSVLKP